MAEDDRYGPWVRETLDHLGVNRYTLPYVVVAVVVNPRGDFPLGVGRPLNGGSTRGGGFLFVSSRVLTKHPNFQSTLEHELGHAFGLTHVDCWGGDMGSSASMMSYNLAHRTRGLRPATEPAVLLPEDVRGLALNQAVFPGLRFDPTRHVPPGYSLARVHCFHGPWDISGLENYGVRVHTEVASLYDTRVRSAVDGPIDPSRGPGVTFRTDRMWHTETLPDGWARLQLEFPCAVRLDALGIHTEHSGKYHRAIAARVAALRPAGARQLFAGALPTADAEVAFPPTLARRWHVELKAGPSRQVTVRGFRFLSGGRPVFPPQHPYPRGD
jgi:hypothetical protein